VKVRLFVAVKLSAQFQQVVTGFIERIAQNSSGVKWVNSRQAHFTLFFLGEQPSSVITRLSPQLKKVAANNHAFTITIGKSGVFPSWKAPRVLWLGLEEGEKPMIRLANQVAEACRKEAGNLKSGKRSFIPHLTLGRVKTSLPVIDFDLFKSGVTGKMSVKEFALIESNLTSQGPIYHELEKFKFKEK
jgi:2'-5' RNA ligase